MVFSTEPMLPHRPRRARPGTWETDFAGSSLNKRATEFFDRVLTPVLRHTLAIVANDEVYLGRPNPCHESKAGNKLLTLR